MNAITKLKDQTASKELTSNIYKRKATVIPFIRIVKKKSKFYGLVHLFPRKRAFAGNE